MGDNFWLIEAGTFTASKGGEIKFTYEGRGERAPLLRCSPGLRMAMLGCKATRPDPGIP